MYNKLILNNCEYTFKIKIEAQRIISYVSKQDEIIGDFCIYSEKLFIPGFTHSLTIGIEDNYTKLGLSKYLIYYMVHYIKQEKGPLDMLFYIDTDASGGFWDYIGMTKNRYGYYSGNRNIEGKGYEKKISLKELELYSFMP